MSSSQPLPAPTESDTAPRPKFARRPASFSRPNAAAQEASEPLAPLPVPNMTLRRPTVTPAGIPWQEDARFGVVMLLLVALVNIALIYGLPLLPTMPVNNYPTEVTAKAPSMPQAVKRDSERVTLYAQPAGERRTLQQLDLKRAGNTEQTEITIDEPPPVARALESHEQ